MCAVENAAFAILVDPADAVVVVIRAVLSVHVLGGELADIEAGKDVQLFARPRILFEGVGFVVNRIGLATEAGSDGALWFS